MFNCGVTCGTVISAEEVIFAFERKGGARRYRTCCCLYGSVRRQDTGTVEGIYPVYILWLCQWKSVCPSGVFHQLSVQCLCQWPCPLLSYRVDLIQSQIALASFAFDLVHALYDLQGESLSGMVVVQSLLEFASGMCPVPKCGYSGAVVEDVVCAVAVTLYRFLVVLENAGRHLPRARTVVVMEKQGFGAWGAHHPVVAFSCGSRACGV